MSSATQVITILAGMTGLIGLQSFWIGRALDRVDHRLDRFETRMDRLTDEVVHEHARRIARLEERLQ